MEERQAPLSSSEEEKPASLSCSDEEEDASTIGRGVRKLWASVNHIAIVVSDVGRSLQFYTDVIGMEQIRRPNFDRYVWGSFQQVGPGWFTKRQVDSPEPTNKV